MAAGRLDDRPVVGDPGGNDQDVDALFAQLAIEPRDEAITALDQFLGRQRRGWLDQEINIAAAPRVIQA